MFDLQSIVRDFIPAGSQQDLQVIICKIKDLIIQYTDVLDMLYIIDIQDPTREEQELSYKVQQSIYELRFLLFQLFHHDIKMPLFDVTEKHLVQYIPFIFYMSRLNKLRLDCK